MSTAQFTTLVKNPPNCSADELAAFCGHVNKGSEVAELTTHWLKAHGAKLVFVHNDGVLAAVGALKKPDQNYHRACFRKAGVPRLWSDYPIELGWIYCAKEYRGGMSYRIIDPLFEEPESHQPIYATVRTDNIPMLRPLQKRNFQPVGIHYASAEHSDAEIQLLVRAAI